MNGNTDFIDKWLSKNFNEIIECPQQPGNLKISKQACQKRLQAADRLRFDQKAQDDLFVFGVKQGLLKCKDCVMIGKLLNRPLIATFEPVNPDNVKMNFNRKKRSLAYDQKLRGF
jgi:hypothetical protein